MEGTVKFDIEHVNEPCFTWYKVYGDLHSTSASNENQHIKPLILSPGGPGACHEYLLPLVDLYQQHQIPLLFYDPVGNGKSSRLTEKAGDDASFWTADLFVRELNNLIDHFPGLRDRGFDFYGHSWGGMLGSYYAATLQPSKTSSGLRKLILANTPASVKLLIEHEKKLLKQFPADVQDAFERAEHDGRFDSEEYQNAAMKFYRRHLCRADPWPEEVMTVMKHLEEANVYLDMYGPSELTCTGTLKDWDTTPIVHQIQVPTLLINGSYDEVGDSAVQPFFDRIPRVRWVTLEGASHMAHIEVRQRYMEVVSHFLLSPL